MVFTNGCFDIVHPGHVHVLRTARSFGDVLFVGVNTDDSVRRLKGPGRPVTPLEDRMTVLSEFRSVDYLIPFDEETPLNLIKEIRPRILVKGGDYTRDSVVGADQVTEDGGRVVIVPILKGYSTTGLIHDLESTFEG